MQSKEILNLLSLGKSVAESDDRLENYFVDTHTFNVVASGQRDVVAGDKGTGKTALYKILMKRYRGIETMRGIEIIPAFNVAGSPVFQQLLNVPVQTEGQYIAFWKTYVLSLVGNWMLEQRTVVRQPSVRRVEYLFDRNQLRSIENTPHGIFTKLLNLFPKSLVPKSFEVELGMNETGTPHLTPKLEFQPAAVAQPPSFFGVDYIAGLHILESALKESNLTVWISIDRLDEAFLGYPGVEIPALRALLRTYLDFKAMSQIRLKLFLRRDLFRKISAGGFVNLTHIDAEMIEIIWDEEDLKNLLIARVKDKAAVVQKLALRGLSNDEVFTKLFPSTMPDGDYEVPTWDWMMSHIKDGNGVIAPRNLIDLVEKAREAQMRAEARNAREMKSGEPLMEADALRKAHKALSDIRVQDTLLAEAADLVPMIEKFRNKPCDHTINELSTLLGVPDTGIRLAIKPLMEIGLLGETETCFRIPRLYRFGLQVSEIHPL